MHAHMFKENGTNLVIVMIYEPDLVNQSWSLGDNDNVCSQILTFVSNATYALPILNNIYNTCVTLCVV